MTTTIYQFTYVEPTDNTPEQHEAVMAARESTPSGTLDEACDLATALECTIELSDATGTKRGVVRPNEDWRLF